jgi:hypothetical protein
VDLDDCSSLISGLVILMSLEKVASLGEFVLRGTFPTNSDGSHLGTHPSIADDGPLHFDLRKAGHLLSDGAAPYALMVFTGMLLWTWD